MVIIARTVSSKSCPYYIVVNDSIIGKDKLEPSAKEDLHTLIHWIPVANLKETGNSFTVAYSKSQKSDDKLRFLDLYLDFQGDEDSMTDQEIREDGNSANKNIYADKTKYVFTKHKNGREVLEIYPTRKSALVMSGVGVDSSNKTYEIYAVWGDFELDRKMIDRVEFAKVAIQAESSQAKDKLIVRLNDTQILSLTPDPKGNPTMAHGRFDKKLLAAGLNEFDVSYYGKREDGVPSVNYTMIQLYLK